MGTTVDDILPLIDIDKCLEETGVKSTFRHCHTACAWLVLKIKKSLIPDYNIHWCTGTFKGLDHSWIVVEDCDNCSLTVIDMTIDQFIDVQVPYTGPQTGDYEVADSVNLSEVERLGQFAEQLGW